MSKRYNPKIKELKMKIQKQSEFIKILKGHNKRLKEQIIESSKVIKDGKVVYKLDDKKIKYKPENKKECEGLQAGKQCSKCVYVNKKGCFNNV